MLSTVFRSDDLPVEQRFDTWRELSSKAVLRTLIDSDRATDFRATLRAAGLGPVQVSAMTYQSMRSRRTPRLVRAADPELYQLALTRGGRQSMTWRDHQLILGDGELFFYDTSVPFTAEIRAGQAAASSVMVQVPRELLPMGRDQVADLLGTRVPASDPIGLLLRQFIDAIAHPAPAGAAPYTAADAGRLGLVLADLLTALLGRQRELAGAPLGRINKDTQLACVQAYIERRLGDLDLTPVAVAEAHHISLRSLHRLFEEQGTGVAGWIRARRLERCHHDLTDPALAGRPIHTIAARWGFPRPADFSRAFRSAYGLTPGAYRRLATTTATATDEPPENPPRRER